MTEDIDDTEAPAEKTFVRSVRLTPSAWAEVQRRAERAGMLVNSYVVWAISRAPERADIRDEAAVLSVSYGEDAVPVGTVGDVHHAAASEVIDDDGDAILAMAARGVDDVLAAYGDGPMMPAVRELAAEQGVEFPQPEQPLPDDVAWFEACGHPDIPENRTKRGPGRPDACRVCRNAATRESRKRVKERALQST